MAEAFLTKYINSQNKIATVIEAGASDPSIKKKILNYIIEDSGSNKAAYLAAIEVFLCGISNSFIKRNDVALDQVEKRLINLAVKHKNDDSISEALCQLIVRVSNLFISQKDISTKNYETKFSVFFSNITTLTVKSNDIASNVVALSLLKHALLVWEDFYSIASASVVSALKALLDKSVSHPMLFRVALCVLQQQPTQELRSYASLLPKLVRSIFSVEGLARFDSILIGSLEDAVVQQSILFRKEFTFIMSSVRDCMAEAGKKIPSRNYECALKSMLLLFDKQREFFFKESPANKQNLIKSVFAVLFDYLATQQTNSQAKQRDSIKSESIVNSPAYSITQFVLKQLRDFSKVLNAKMVVPVYKELFNSMKTTNPFAAFIGFSTIGEYKGEVSDLEEFGKAAKEAIRKGNASERFAALQGIMLLCDFLGTKFTGHFEKSLLREGLIPSLVELAHEERGAVYSALTLFIGNLGEGALKKEDIRVLVEAVCEDVKEESEKSREGGEATTQYYALILVDSLVEKFKKEVSGYAEKVYALIKRVGGGKSEELAQLRLEVQANFMRVYGEDSEQIKSEFDELVRDVISSRDAKETLEVLCHQINVLFKLTKAAEALGIVDQKKESLIKELVRITESTIELLAQKKKQEENEENAEESTNEVENLKNGSEEFDLNAPRHAFAALSILFEGYKNGDVVHKLGLRVLGELNDHLSMRDAVLEVLPKLLLVLKSENHCSFEESVHEMVKSIVSNLQQETDQGAVLDQLELIGKTLQSVGKCFDSAEIVKSIMVYLFEICEGAAQALSNEPRLGGKKAKGDNDDDDDDDDEGEDEEEEEPHDLQLVQLVGPIIEQIYRTHPDEAYLCFDDIICERVMGLCESEDERFKLVGLNVLSNILAIYPYEKLKDYMEEYLAYFTEGVSSKSYPLRQTSVFGIGMLCQIVPREEFKQFQRYLSGAIMACIMTEDQVIDEEGDEEDEEDDDDSVEPPVTAAKGKTTRVEKKAESDDEEEEEDGSEFEDEIDEEAEEDFGYFMDNSISALCKLIKYQNITKELGPLIDLLPLKVDSEEALVCHENFIDLVIAKRIGDEFAKEVQACLERIEASPFINDAIRAKLAEVKSAQ